MKLAEKIELMKSQIPETAMWLDTFRMNSKHTQLGYATNLATVLSELGITSFDGVKSFQSADISRLYEIAEKREWSKQALNAYVANFKRFIEWCNAEGLCENHALNRYRKLKSESEPTYVFTYDEQKRLMDSLTSKRLRCMLNVYLETGCRKMSIQDLKLDDFKGNTITVTDKGDKTTLHTLPDWLVDMLNDYIVSERKETMERFTSAGGTDCDWMFVSNFSCGRNNTDFANGLHMAPNALNEQIKNAARKAGIESWNKVHPHSFRKRFGITEYYSNGMDIIATQRAMNHSNVKQTAYYVGKYDIQDAEKKELASLNPNAHDELNELRRQFSELNDTIRRQQEIINTLLGLKGEG